MKMIKTILILGILGAAGYYAFTKYFLPGSATWLHGTWWYADASGRIVSGKKKDGMLFFSNGTVDLIKGSGKRYLSCVYTDLIDGEIRVECEVRGKKKELIFLIGDNNSELSSTADSDGGSYIKE